MDSKRTVRRRVLEYVDSINSEIINCREQNSSNEIVIEPAADLDLVDIDSASVSSDRSTCGSSLSKISESSSSSDMW
jgi:hypothetical protein